MGLICLCLFMPQGWCHPQTRECIDWRWPLQCVHSVMMVFRGPSLLRVEWGCSPTTFHSPPPLELCRPSSPPPHPSPASIARYSNLYSNQSPLSPSLWCHRIQLVLLTGVDSLGLCWKFQHSQWWLGTDQEKGFCTGPPGYKGCRNRFPSSLKV